MSSKPFGQHAHRGESKRQIVPLSHSRPVPIRRRTPNLAEYAYYNYTDPNRTPEAELVRKCLVAWDTPRS